MKRKTARCELEHAKEDMRVDYDRALDRLKSHFQGLEKNSTDSMCSGRGFHT